MRRLRPARATSLRLHAIGVRPCRRSSSSFSETRSVHPNVAAAAVEPVPEPTPQQLRALFVSRAIPMVGFGFMDQTIMLQMGNAIDLSIGVTFGLSTLAAAALGQICSDSAGVLFGGTLENLAKACGLPRSGLSSAQRALPLVKKTKLMGSLVGVLCGCLLGLLNLFFLDTDKASNMKLQLLSEEQEFSFEVEASNAERNDATVLTVRGPDVDGLLASITGVFADVNCSIVEVDAHPLASKGNNIEVIFAVVKRGTDEKIPDEDLDDLAETLLTATTHPVNIHTFKAQVKDLEERNAALLARARRLETTIQHQQIHILPTSGK